MNDLKYEDQSTFPLWGRVNLILGTGTENQIFIVYQMGRLCGGAHEISGIKAPFFSVVAWMVGWGWCSQVGVEGWVVVCEWGWRGGWWCGDGGGWVGMVGCCGQT